MTNWTEIMHVKATFFPISENVHMAFTWSFSFGWRCCLAGCLTGRRHIFIADVVISDGLFQMVLLPVLPDSRGLRLPSPCETWFFATKFGGNLATTRTIGEILMIKEECRFDATSVLIDHMSFIQNGTFFCADSPLSCHYFPYFSENIKSRVKAKGSLFHGFTIGCRAPILVWGEISELGTKM